MPGGRNSLGRRSSLPLPFPVSFVLRSGRCGPVEGAIWVSSPYGITVSESDPKRNDRVDILLANPVLGRTSLESMVAGSRSPLRKVSERFESVQEGIAHSFCLWSMARLQGGYHPWLDPCPCWLGLSR